MALPRIKPRREELQPGQSLCDFCTAKCCRYFALPIDKPTTWEEFDFLRWFLLHDRACCFTEDGSWYVLVHTDCKHLQADNRCGIFGSPDRPEVCGRLRPEPAMCGTTREHALQWIAALEAQTAPGRIA